MKDVEGKVAFVTGGSSGIGRGIALAFARAGMCVVATGRRPQHLEESAALFAAEGLDIVTMQLDVGGKTVSTPADVRKALADARTDKKRTVLMRMKSGDATRFVAIPIAGA